MVKLNQCNLCGSVDGESADGEVIKIGEYNVCNICRSRMGGMTEKYAIDFRERLGQEVHEVLPYPAFKTPHFNFPPYNEVYVASSYVHGSHQFAVATTDTCLIAGRRSIQSIMAELRHEIEEIDARIEAGVSPEELKLLRFQRTQLEHRIEQSEKYNSKGGTNAAKIGPDECDRTGRKKAYRSLPLYRIPYRDMDEPVITDRGNWIGVKIPYRKIKVGFFGGKKWGKDEVYWLISKEGKPFVDALARRIRDAANAECR